MARRRFTRSVAAGDNFNLVTNILGMEGAAGELVLIEGLLQAQTNGVTIYQSEGPGDVPSATGAGIDLSTGAGVGTDRATKAEVPMYDLARLWVRNTTAGSNGVLVIQGVIEGS